MGSGRGSSIPRLDVNEGRGHDEELAGHVEVHLLHQIEVLEVLLRDQRDRDVVDVQLVLLDEVQEQIERALEIDQADRVVLEDRFEFELLRLDPCSTRGDFVPAAPP